MMTKDELKQKFLNQRSNKFTIVLNDNELNLFRNIRYLNKMIITSQYEVVFIASILHDRDTDDITKQVKTKHFHVVIQFSNNYRISSIINLLTDTFHCNENQITIDKCNNLPMQARYLLHLDDGDKEPYFPFEVETNNQEEFTRYCKTEKVKDLKQLVSIVKRYNYDLEEIMLNILNYDKWRRYINDLIINYNRRRI